MIRKPAIGLAVLALAGAALLGGCNYRPLYGSSADNAGVAAIMASVAISEADTRVGQIIRNDLISAMRPGNSAAADRYVLTLLPEIKASKVIDKAQPATTRQSMRLVVAYQLVDQQSGTAVHSGKTFSQASFDLVREPFADMQAETDATARAAHEVSADIRTRLAAYFSSRQ